MQDNLAEDLMGHIACCSLELWMSTGKKQGIIIIRIRIGEQSDQAGLLYSHVAEAIACCCPCSFLFSTRNDRTVAAVENPLGTCLYTFFTFLFLSFTFTCSYSRRQISRLNRQQDSRRSCLITAIRTRKHHHNFIQDRSSRI